MPLGACMLIVHVYFSFWMPCHARCVNITCAIYLPIWYTCVLLLSMTLTDPSRSLFIAVCMDLYGHVAAATSTGGLTNKRFDRVGDSPVIGAGTRGVWGCAREMSACDVSMCVCACMRVRVRVRVCVRVRVRMYMTQVLHVCMHIYTHAHLYERMPRRALMLIFLPFTMQAHTQTTAPARYHVRDMASNSFAIVLRIRCAPSWNLFPERVWTLLRSMWCTSDCSRFAFVSMRALIAICRVDYVYSIRGRVRVRVCVCMCTWWLWMRMWISMYVWVCLCASACVLPLCTNTLIREMAGSLECRIRAKLRLCSTQRECFAQVCPFSIFDLSLFLFFSFNKLKRFVKLLSSLI